MIRKLFIVASALSLLLFVATLILYVCTFNGRHTQWCWQFAGRRNVLVVTRYEIVLLRADPTWFFADRVLSVQSVFPLGALAVLPIAWSVSSAGKRIRGHRNSISTLCPSCGYDLRASKERCPECGTRITVATTSS
jgi:predicted RNA-binding Zn-ribbon protein involved in translation (DUF1610 family)